jgi:hypothetical protein
VVLSHTSPSSEGGSDCLARSRRMGGWEIGVPQSLILVLLFGILVLHLDVAFVVP